MRGLLLILVVAGWALAGTGYAQMRILPANAKGAILGRPLPLPYVRLNHKVVRLAPGAVIYDQNNRFILQNALPVGAAVAFTIDMNGNVARIYILTAQEQSQFNFK
jgi:hypothetical protein